MANNNYQAGVATERRLKSHLEALGCYVMRSAGSRGSADLIALERPIGSAPIVRFIQCKVGDFEWTYIVSVIRELAEYEEIYNVISELWYYQGAGKWKVYRPDLFLKQSGQHIYWHMEEYDDEGLMKESKAKRPRPKYTRKAASKVQQKPVVVKAKVVARSFRPVLNMEE